jgi:Abnormal spindle-like microcephaly-assoc'd, ASPM-SPD-2-Hydin
LSRTRHSVFLALVPVCILAVSVTGCGAPAIPSVGNLVLSPTSVSFGSVQVGQTAAATLSLGNNGSASIQISQIQFSSPDFSLSGPAALPITLAVGESYILTLKFAPSAPGAASGSMSLATSGLSAPATVSLSGTGEAKPATPGLRLQPASVSFGDVQIGTTAAQSVTVISSGTAALTISGVSATSRGFSASGLTLPASLNPGQTADPIISFNPTVAGTATGSVTLVTNATSGSATVPLSAAGVKTLYEVDLTWEQPASSSDPPVGYEIFRAVNGSAVYTLLNSTIDPSTAYTDTTAQNGATYSYYVESVDNEGNQSAPSTIFSVTIPN